MNSIFVGIISLQKVTMSIFYYKLCYDRLMSPKKDKIGISILHIMNENSMNMRLIR